MLKIGLRSAKKRIWGLTASILAVFLGVTFIASTLSLKDVITDTFAGVVDTSTNGAAYLRVKDAASTAVSVDEASERVPLDLAAQLEQVDGVAKAVPDVFGNMVLVGSDGTALATGGAPTLVFSAYESPGTVMIEGRAPSAPNEIGFTDLTFEKAGYQLGDTVTAILDGEIHKFTLVGVSEFGAAAGALVTFIDPTLGQELLAPDSKTSAIAVFSEKQGAGSDLVTLTDKNEQEFVNSINAALPGLLTASDGTQLELLTGTQMRDLSMEEVESQVGFIITFVLAFAVISVLVSAFVISNTFAMITRQQQREYALLRAIGASPGQVFSIVCVQALVVGIIGGVLGLGASYLFLKAMPSVLGAMGMDLTSDASMSATTIVSALAIGVVVSLAAAVLSARRAASTPPMEAMRDSAAPDLSPPKIKTVIGLALFVIGAGCAIAATIIANGQDKVTTTLLYGVGALGFAVGTILLAATIARPLIAVFAAPLKRVFKPVAQLAAGNVQRNPKRTASTASALVLGTALTSAAAIFAASVNASIGDVLEQELKADLIIQSQTFNIAPSARDEMFALDAVDTAGSFVAGLVEIPQLADPEQDTQDSSSQPGDKKQLEIGATELTSLHTLWHTEITEGDPDAFDQGKALVQKSMMDANNWELGQTLTFTGDKGTTETTIGGVFDSVALGVPLLIPLDQFNDTVPAEQQQIANIMLTSNSDLETLRAQVTEVAKPYMVLSVLDQEEFTSNLSAQIDQMLMIIYALLALTIAIAIIGIVNTLSLGVLERTREIGLLRAVGLSKSQLHLTISLESVFTALLGTLVGLFVGIGVTLGVPVVFKEQGFTQLEIPWGALLVILGLSVLVGVFAALWPAIRANRIPLLKAIGDSE